MNKRYARTARMFMFAH